MEIIENELSLPVVCAKTGKLSRTDGVRATSAVRMVRNAAFPHFFPNSPAVILDYGKVRDDARKSGSKAQARSGAKVDVVSVVNSAIEKALKSKVYYKYEKTEGVIYDDHPEYNGMGFNTAMGGSMTKKAMVIGLPDDIYQFPHDWGLFKSAEDVVRGSRLFFANARFGSTLLDKSIRVGFAPPGTRVGDYSIEDGCGIIRASLPNAVRDAQEVQDRIIQLGSAKQNYQISSRFEWSDIAEEVVPLVQDNMNWQANPDRLRVRAFANQHSIEEWTKLEPLLLGHPMCTKALVGNDARFLAELASTIPLNGYARVAIPCFAFISPEPGTWMVVRYPVDSFGNIRVFECYNEQWIEWINKQEAIQYSFVNRELGGKGNLVLVDDAIMDELGLDILFCSEDVKVMRDYSLGDFKKKIAENGITKWEINDPLYFGILQWWGPGSCFGISYEEWVKLGGDFDGDMGILNNVTDLPRLTAAIRALPEQESHKMDKTANEWWQRYTMLTYAMVNGIGFASNLVTTILGGGIEFAETEVVKILPRNNLSHDPIVRGHLDGTASGLWKETNRWIKMCTDGFKRMINVPKLIQYLFALQSIITGFFSGSAPWTSWGQDRNTYAFRRGLPEFEYEIAENDPAFYSECMASGEVGRNARNGWRWRSRIGPMFEGSTPAMIYRIAKPDIELWLQYFSANGVTPLISDITCAPLSEFANWAVMVEDKDIVKADEIYNIYLPLIGNVNWSDENDEFSSVHSFKVRWQRACSEWAKQFSSREYAASVLWRRAHMSTSDESRAAAPFYGFPQETRQIVIDKPGLKERDKQYRTVLVGLNYNFVQVPYHMTGLHVEVVNAVYKLKRRTVVIAATAIGGLRTGDINLPEFTIGLVAELDASDFRQGFSVPPPGEYSMDFKKADTRGKAWYAWLSPLSRQ